MRASQKPRPFPGRYGALAGGHCWRPRRRPRVSPALPDEETMLKTGMKDLQPLSASHLHLKTPPLLTGRRQAQALRGRRGGLRALRRQRTKPAGQRDPFERCARSWPCPPSLLHSNLPAVQCHDVTFELLRAKLEGERNCRPAHASATCAYPRDQNHELSHLCPLAQAVRRTCARRLGDLHPRRCAWRSPDP